MMTIDMTTSICLSDSSHSSWINARSSSSSKEASDDGYELEDDDDAEELGPGFETSWGKVIGMLRGSRVALGGVLAEK
jgi:hypothetical protein